MCRRETSSNPQCGDGEGSAEVRGAGPAEEGGAWPGTACERYFRLQGLEAEPRFIATFEAWECVFGKRHHRGEAVASGVVGTEHPLVHMGSEGSFGMMLLAVAVETHLSKEQGF